MNVCSFFSLAPRSKNTVYIDNGTVRFYLKPAFPPPPHPPKKSTMLLHSIISSAVLGLLCNTSLAAPIKLSDIKYIGFVYEHWRYEGEDQYLFEGCTILGPNLAGKVSSFMVFEWACNFYRSSDCGEGFMFEADNRSDETLKGKDNDAVQSIWCNTL